MKPSTHDGKSVLYVDHFKLTHSGTIVGQSDDGSVLLVQSDKQGVKPAPFHFTITPEILPAVLVK